MINKHFCGVSIAPKDTKIFDFKQYQKSDKILHLFMHIFNP